MAPLPHPTGSVPPRAEPKASRATAFFVLGLALLAVIAFIDWATWPDIQLRLCYLIPTVVLAWYAGTSTAMPVAVLGSLVWLAIELRLQRSYEHPAVPYINALILLVASMVLTLLVAAEARRKRQLASEIQARRKAEDQLLTINETLEQRVRERTAAAESRALALQASEQALSRSSAFLTAILSTMTEAVVVTERHGRLRLLNPAAAKLLNLSHAVDSQMLLPPTSTESLGPLLEGYRGAAAVIAEALAGTPLRAVELGRRISQVEGGPWLVVSSHQIPMAPDSEAGVVFVLTDISASKETERAVADAIEEEQQRIGQDLHDGLGQHLVCTAMAVSLLRDQLARDPRTGPETVVGIASMVDEAITHVRDIARGLFPASLEHQGLAATLNLLADQVTRSTRIRCEFESASMEVEPPVPVAFHLYRIAQEAIANAIRHNSPARIILRLEEPDKSLRLSVISVGKPVANGPVGRAGIGLAIMQHRARLIQGDLQIYNEPQGDTVVECTVSHLPTGS